MKLGLPLLTQILLLGWYPKALSCRNSLIHCLGLRKESLNLFHWVARSTYQTKGIKNYQFDEAEKGMADG